MRLVMVEWVDSFGCTSNWGELVEDCQPEPIVCKSVGWLFRETSECMVIVPHVADVPGDSPKQGCGDMTIPVRCIRQTHDLAIRDVDPAPSQKERRVDNSEWPQCR